MDSLGAGVFIQDRGWRVYQACLALWVAPGGETLLRITGGKTAGLPIKRTIVTSFVEPDRIVETSDDFGAADLSGLTDRKLVLNADLDELLTRHQERLAELRGLKRGISTANALATLEAMRGIQAKQMERLGLVKFLDRDRTVWRHTLKGAILSFWGLRAQMVEAQSQVDRITRKRPGQKGKEQPLADAAD